MGILFVLAYYINNKISYSNTSSVTLDNKFKLLLSGLLSMIRVIGGFGSYLLKPIFLLLRWKSTEKAGPSKSETNLIQLKNLLTEHQPNQSLRKKEDLSLIIISVGNDVQKAFEAIIDGTADQILSERKRKGTAKFRNMKNFKKPSLKNTLSVNKMQKPEIPVDSNQKPEAETFSNKKKKKN